MKNKISQVCIFLLLLTVSCTKEDNIKDNTENENVEDNVVSATMEQVSIGDIGYWLYTPKNANDNMPLIVYLHGGSSRGDDLDLVIGGSLPKFLHEGTVADIPAFILMPQCPAEKTWEQIHVSIIELIDWTISDKKNDIRKVSLTGHSLGGSGTWRLGAIYATKFSCIAPLSGSAEIKSASSYTDFPVWAFVGSADDIVKPNSSEAIVSKINSLGGSAQLKSYKNATHFEVPELAYKDSDAKLLEWMISQIR